MTIPQLLTSLIIKEGGEILVIPAGIIAWWCDSKFDPAYKAPRQCGDKTSPLEQEKMGVGEVVDDTYHRAAWNTLCAVIGSWFQKEHTANGEWLPNDDQSWLPLPAEWMPPQTLADLIHWGELNDRRKMIVFNAATFADEHLISFRETLIPA